MVTSFSSEGFDLDALPTEGREQGKDVVFELGGKATTNASAVEKEEEQETEQDPTARAEELKARGNDYFKNRKYLDAYDLYTEAMEACPGITGEELLVLKEEFDAAARERAMQRYREEQEERHKNGGKSQERPEPSPPEEFKPPAHEYSTKLAVYHCNRAACSLHLERYDEAIRDCDVAVMLNPKYAKAYIRRMTAYEKTERTEEALKDAKQALQYDPTNATTKRHVARLQKLEEERLEKLKEETMGKLKDLGNSILGNFGLSLDNFQAEKDPNTGSYSISFNQNK